MKIGSLLNFIGVVLVLLPVFFVWTIGPSAIIFVSIILGIICSWVGYYLHGRGQ